MSDKGHVYYCSWKKDRENVFVGWDIQHPFLRATAGSKGELVSMLGDMVGEYHNDHEAALDFDPPLSVGEGEDHLFADELCEVIWNTAFSFRQSRDTAFSKGRCKRCGGGLGQRTSSPLIVDTSVAGTDGAFSPESNAPPSSSYGEPAKLMIVSEAFLGLLNSREKARFDAKPVIWNPKRPVRFYEVVPHVLIPQVAIKGREVQGWKCGVCGRQVFGHAFKATGGGDCVVSRSDIPSPLPPCLFVGSPTDVRFFISRKRWVQMRGKPGARGLMSWRLATVDEALVDRKPRLESLQ